ncbi:MAG: response regulator [Deltaproteobacteria bacterium]|nr:response regulator [Deltaproteobacteria bacterium]
MPTLLIIDDDDNIGVVLRKSLRGYDVTLATTAEEGLDLVSRRAFDGILCDLHLPRKSGVDFHAALVAMRPELEPRLLFMTGGALTPEAEHFLSERPDQVVSKPFELERIRRTVARIVQRTAPLAPGPVTIVGAG